MLSDRLLGDRFLALNVLASCIQVYTDAQVNASDITTDVCY